MGWRFSLAVLLSLCAPLQTDAFTAASSQATPGLATFQLRGGHGKAKCPQGDDAAPLWFAAATAVSMVGVLKSRQQRTAMRGMKDRVKKDFSVKSAMIRRLGKWRLMKEFDMRSQIMSDPMMAKRLGKTTEALIEDFNVASNYLKDEFGMTDQVAEICISKVATGLNMQFLGKPNIPTNAQMQVVTDWICANLAVKKEDGTLKDFLEKYPFVLGRTEDDLEESINFCPEDINYSVAVADDPALIDKTFNCQGICQNQCIACWYNG
eukprot:gb/GFBE01081637.1/.p1 GENE.gb/GFBE01081637.1/~~gb/GFBE01081637.1/.p1  ORF type:complete len:265 (+),score=74.63 gb/GFBE01081637.1/:1-795(+)